MSKRGLVAASVLITGIVVIYIMELGVIPLVEQMIN
jgi:antibiotic biosynthesis monooxygenase (ABM) superfamily enzyme